MKIDYAKHRAVIEAHYGDRLTVFKQERVANPMTHASKVQVVKKYENLPCHLDWGAAQTSPARPVADTSQEIKVLLAPEPVIEPGSSMEITTEAGLTYTFKSSSPASVVPSHQEISLERVDKA